MLLHIALFAWKEGTKKKDIQKILDDVRALKNKIPRLIDIRCGQNFSRWAEGFTHAVIVLAKDEKSLDAYRKHPEHVNIAHRIEAIEMKSLGVDFKD